MTENFAQPLRESDRFRNPKRCQRPIMPRQDTYIAEDIATGKRCFVKGPYQNADKAGIAVRVQKLKLLATASLGLPIVDYHVEQLVADLFPESRARFGFDLARPWWFLVCADLSAPRPLPLKTVPPNKQWAEPMQVIDWEQMVAEGMHSRIPFAERYEESIYTHFPTAARWLALHILLDWIFGVGGDLASRNFIMFVESQEVFNVDTDILGAMDWQLGNAQICSARSKNGQFFKRYLESGACDADLAVVRQNLQSHPSWKQYMPLAARKEALRRSALDKADIYVALQGKPTKPRDASPKRQ